MRICAADMDAEQNVADDKIIGALSNMNMEDKKEDAVEGAVE